MGLTSIVGRGQWLGPLRGAPTRGFASEFAGRAGRESEIPPGKRELGQGLQMHLLREQKYFSEERRGIRENHGVPGGARERSSQRGRQGETELQGLLEAASWKGSMGYLWELGKCGK